ncbi:unnamed protein product [Hydatigera taeniaeformis]|uniref:ubiquitinyl hydrolase 1 n=1 Tax=Hydatigena taeniaeformis TaxID=6205 RepID=A0A0R3WPH3_HYDTA|nr:unnamed protein product [Hydatigera taeniaeformis]
MILRHRCKCVSSTPVLESSVFSAIMEESSVKVDYGIHSSVPPRPSKKRSFVNLLKKFLDNSSRSQTDCVSTLNFYRKSCAIASESDKKDRGNKSVLEKARKISSVTKSMEPLEISHRKKSMQTDAIPKLSTPSGLENLGNTCYLNAILQCLRSTELVRDYCDTYDDISSKQLRLNGNLFPTFAALIRKMELVNNGRIGSSTIQRFKDEFTKFVPCYGGNLQQDASEFLTYLLDGLHEETKERPQTPTPNESTLTRPISTVASPPASIVPAKCGRRYKLRMGGLKNSESSGKLNAAIGRDAEAWPDTTTFYQSKPKRKMSRLRRSQVRAVSISRVDSLRLDDLCQPGL